MFSPEVFSIFLSFLPFKRPWSFSDHNPRSGIAVRGDERDQVGDGDGTKWKVLVGSIGSNIAAVQSSGSSLAQTEIGERISRFRPRARHGQLKIDLFTDLPSLAEETPRKPCHTTSRDSVTMCDNV